MAGAINTHSTVAILFLFVSLSALLPFAAEAARCDGLPGGTLLIHESFADCNRYIACQHDTDHEWYCPTGEFFNPRNLQCEATCPTGRETLWCAGVPDGAFIRVPPTQAPNCQQYYTCFGGNMFLNTCPQGFFFSQLLQACTFSQDDC
uniref:Chitin-binding type-2 domain-containing protein n=4 Tax=gambiae species complex TaxID=44542 RepID=A0A1S4HCV7_ANOGA